MIGAKAMIGTEFAATANGSRARLAVAQRAIANATTSAGHTADHKTSDRLGEGVASDGHELVEVLDEGRCDRARWRQEELLDPESLDRELPQAENADENGDGRKVVTKPLPQLAATSAAPGFPTWWPRSRSRTRVMKPK